MQQNRFIVAALALVIGSPSSYGQSNATLTLQRTALKDITDAAERICNSIPLSGTSQSAELSGQAKAEVNGVIKRFADLGIQGAGKYQASEFSNVLQRDLAQAIQQNANCKQTVFSVLVDRMIPAQSPLSAPAPAIQSRPAAGPPGPTTASPQPSVRQSLRDGDAIIVDVHLPTPRGQQEESFLRGVGDSVNFTMKNYDPESGRGDIGATSFGYANGRITATDTSLNIANSSSMGCSGSFRRTEAGVLRGKISCRWGNPYPSYDATIDLGR